RGLLDQDQKPDQDQQIASKLAPTGPLESITYFVFDKSELASRSFKDQKIARQARSYRDF
ncbi:MAG: hypothetical protein ACTIBJ_08985, partial [Pseudomonas helleri]|uniref:hypothetical protein n=1 Tax=Pseudomonas helleri TaxID=1608996 RepID=UPI003F956321